MASISSFLSISLLTLKVDVMSGVGVAILQHLSRLHERDAKHLLRQGPNMAELLNLSICRLLVN